MIYIPIKDNGFRVMNIFDPYTGERLGQIDGIQDVNITKKLKRDYVRDKNENKVLSFNHDPTYELTFNADSPIDKEEFYRILGVNMAKMPDAYTIQYIKFVPARKYKKKRINKKWLKRYGYKQILAESKGWKIIHYTNGETEFIK